MDVFLIVHVWKGNLIGFINLLKCWTSEEYCFYPPMVN